MRPTLPRSLVLLSLALAVLLAACSTGAAPPAKPAAPAAPAPQSGAAPAPASQPSRPAPAKIVLGATGSGAGTHFWPDYVGIAKGFFADEALDVEIVAVPSAQTLSQALISGDVQLVTFTVLSMAVAVAGGAPLTLVASAQNVPSVQMVVAPSINGWADLKGKTIGGGNTSGDYFDVMMHMMMAANGLQQSDYIDRTMPSPARVPTLIAGQIQGAILPDFDAVAALAAGNKSLGYVGDFVKDIQYSGYLVDDNWARTNDEKLVRFLRALLRSSNWLFDPANKDEAIRIMQKEAADLDAAQVEGVYRLMVTQRMLSQDLQPNMRGIENILNIAHEQGALPEIPPYDKWIDLSYLEKAKR